MHLFSIKLPLIRKNDPLFEILLKALRDDDKSLNHGDIIVISEKVIATSQGRVVNLSEVNEISEEAKKLSNEHEMDERYVELILQEATMILGGMKNVILTKVNDFLIANAGIDQSNAGLDNVVLLPKNPKEIAWNYWKDLREEFNLQELGVIIADSRVQPLRKGTIGIAVATAGFEPIEDCRGKPDLYNRPLKITLRAIADDLVSAAQFLLGESNEQTPIVIIRGAKVDFSENPQFSPEMDPEECLYMNIFSKYLQDKEKKDERKNSSEFSKTPTNFEIVSRLIGAYWEIELNKNRQYGKSDEPDPKMIRNLDFLCANCVGKNLICIHSDGYGSNAGGWIQRELLCKDCGWYTTYEHEYG